MRGAKCTTLVFLATGTFATKEIRPSALYTGTFDGLMDVYIVKKVSLFTFARLIGKYANGHADDLPQYVTHLRGTDLYIEFDGEDVINLDGEALFANSVNMHLIPRALRLIVPAGLGVSAPNSPFSA